LSNYVRKLILRNFEGSHVETAGTYKKALKILEQRSKEFYLALSDIQIPPNSPPNESDISFIYQCKTNYPNLMQLAFTSAVLTKDDKRKLDDMGVPYISDISNIHTELKEKIRKLAA